MYAAQGRPSIPPERLLRALLLQVLYTVRSERLLMGQLDYNFLFRWFVGLSIDDPVWDVTVFTKNRDRVTPHFARKQTSTIDERTTRHPGYELSQRKRKRVEEIFGWVKTVGSLRKTRHRGVALFEWMFTLAIAAYNLLRMRNLVSAPA
jgi:hypothetical protein